MKSNIFKLTFAGVLFLAMTACSENAWNDHLDGFEEPSVYSTKEILTYTLTDTDYTTISGLSENKEIAQAEGEEAVKALAAIGTNKAFANQEESIKYLPALMQQSSFPYFSVNNGSSIKVSYNLLESESETVTRINATETGANDLLRNTNVYSYTISENDYQEVWESDDDYVNAFTPSTTASKHIPRILASVYDDAEAGEMVFVTYNESQQNPVFGSGSGTTTEKISEIASVAKDDEVTLQGTVTAICNRGFILTDNTGSIFIYQSSFDIASVTIGSQVKTSGKVEVYATGMQLKDVPFTVEGTSTYSYPTPETYTASMIDTDSERTSNCLAKYVTVRGTASVSGNYINVKVDGASHTVSLTYLPDNLKSMLKENTEQTFTGYYVYNSGDSHYFNIVVTSIDGSANAPRRTRRAPAGILPTNEKYALYILGSEGWNPVEGVYVVQPSDFTAMGLSYSNFSGTQPASYVPILLDNIKAYAAEDVCTIVAYKYYANKSNYYQASEYTFKDGKWGVNDLRTQSTDQYVKRENVWKFDPSFEITLPYSRNTDPSYSYYMACVNWVFENISKPDYGSTSLTSAAFIDYRGNAEFYGGASAYYGNVDVRAVTARKNAPADYTGYEGLTDDEVSMIVKKRFCTEVMKGALSMIHPDAKPADGIEVLYTLQFYAYDTDEAGNSAARLDTLVYEVVGPAQFKYKNCTWFKNKEDEGWE